MEICKTDMQKIIKYLDDAAQKVHIFHYRAHTSIG